jgi:hypothetical protein
MGNELLVVLIVLAALALCYLWIYPTFAGESPKRLAWLDLGAGAIVFAIVAVIFWQSDPVFRFVFFDTNWFVFGLLTYTILEIPLFALYLKARNISWGDMYGTMLAPKGSPDAAWASASVKAVEKQLNDTKWDGLRTPTARRVLVISSNLILLLGTGFLFVVGDNAWASYALIHILLLGVCWFLLRQSVRLVTEAPVEALDERLERKRDTSYLFAYRYLSIVVALTAAAVMATAIRMDLDDTSDGFTYLISITWPQVQGIFWLILGYAFMLPAMVLAWREAKLEVVR